MRLSIRTVSTSVLLLLSVCPCPETGGTDGKSFQAKHFEKIFQKNAYHQGVDAGRDAREVHEAPETHLPGVGMKL